MTNFSIQEDITVTNLHVSNDASITNNLNVIGSTTVSDKINFFGQKIGYTNTDTWKTQVTTNLNIQAGKTAAQGTPLQLPVGAHLRQVTIIATEAVTGSATMDFGTGVNTGVTSAGFFDGVDIDNATVGTGLGTLDHYLINLQPTITNTFVAEPVEVATTGSTQKRIVSNTTNFVTATTKGANILTGAIKVIIDYDLIPV